MTSGHSLSTEQAGERVRVTVRGETLADTTSAVVLYETGLPARYYLPRADIRMDLLEPTTTSTHCPFKGDAVYWTAKLESGDVVDIAWSYPSPIDGREDITELICFFNERVDELVVGEIVEERPQTQWSEQAELQPHPEV